MCIKAFSDDRYTLRIENRLEYRTRTTANYRETRSPDNDAQIVLDADGGAFEINADGLM